jgi:hypothetical protein
MHLEVHVDQLVARVELLISSVVPIQHLHTHTAEM